MRCWQMNLFVDKNKVVWSKELWQFTRVKEPPGSCVGTSVKMAPACAEMSKRSCNTKITSHSEATLQDSNGRILKNIPLLNNRVLNPQPTGQILPPRPCHLAHQVSMGPWGALLALALQERSSVQGSMEGPIPACGTRWRWCRVPELNPYTQDWTEVVQGPGTLIAVYGARSGRGCVGSWGPSACTWD